MGDGMMQAKNQTTFMTAVVGSVLTGVLFFVALTFPPKTSPFQENLVEKHDHM
jgi:hypothetical protein